MILYQTCEDEIRDALGAEGITNLYNDALAKRFILKHSTQQQTYYFNNYGNGNFVYQGVSVYDYFYQPSFTEFEDNIYQCNANGTIHPATSYDIEIISIEPSPSDAFTVAGDYTQHFITGSTFDIIGPATLDGSIVLSDISTITNSGTYTTLSSSFDGTYTHILVDDIASASVESGLIRFSPLNTDVRSQLAVSALLIDFAEVMHDILYYLATSVSRKELQSLMGSSMGGYLDPYDMLIKSARRWRGIWSIK